MLGHLRATTWVLHSWREYREFDSIDLWAKRSLHETAKCGKTAGEHEHARRRLAASSGDWQERPEFTNLGSTSAIPAVAA